MKLGRLTHSIWLMPLLLFSAVIINDLKQHKGHNYQASGPIWTEIIAQAIEQQQVRDTSYHHAFNIVLSILIDLGDLILSKLLVHAANCFSDILVKDFWMTLKK